MRVGIGRIILAKENRKYSDKNLSNCYLVRHKSRMGYPGQRGGKLPEPVRGGDAGTERSVSLLEWLHASPARPSATNSMKVEVKVKYIKIVTAVVEIRIAESDFRLMLRLL
jgi:hypothetical protein